MMTIRHLRSPARKPKYVPRAKTIRAVWMGDHATGIVTVERDDTDRALGRRTHVVDLAELPANAGAVVAWLTKAAPTDVTIVSDEGIGGALWKLLGIDNLRGDERRAWRLYTHRGRERQLILDDLIVAQGEGRLTSVQGLSGAGAIKRAMLANHAVGDDGVLGSELFSALALAVAGKIPGKPVVY